MNAPLKQFLVCFGPANIPSIFGIMWRFSLLIIFYKHFYFSYKRDFGLLYQGSLFKGCWFYYIYIFFLCKFNIHKCKFTKGKPLFMLLEKEIKMYVDLKSKLIYVPPLTFSHNIKNKQKN